MTNVLPQQAGLEVSGIFYRYTAVKDPESDMIVYVQNEDALNEGEYIFREVDDWSGRPGKTINKYIPQPLITIDRWGDGSIEVEGQGTVEDPLVTYDYRYDPCFDPQSRPDCPGYVPPVPDVPDFDIDAYYDEMNKLIEDEEEKKKIEPDDDDEEERQRKQVQQVKRERLEVALGAVNSALMNAEAQAQYASLMSLALIPPTYINKVLPTTVYEDTRTLKDANLPDNAQGRRANFAQQLLHKQMVDLQYEQPKQGEQ
jgi:hypothetical protein